jgi:hypothetical protein
LQVILVSLTTTMAVAVVPPKVTAVVPVNPVPVIVTGVPPATATVNGETEVGAAGGLL